VVFVTIELSPEELEIEDEEELHCALTPDKSSSARIATLAIVQRANAAADTRKQAVNQQ
jgi:hypothetical protein